MILKFKSLVIVSFLLCQVLLYGQNGQLDTDNDGITNVQDVDDDNDGILDVDENVRESRLIRNWINRVNTGSNNSNNLIFSNGLPGWSNGASSIPFGDIGYDADYRVFYKIHISQKLAVGIGLNDTSRDISDIENGFYYENLTFKIIKQGTIQPTVYNFVIDDQFNITYNGNTVYFYHKDILIDQITLEEDLNFAFDSSFFGFENGTGQGQVKDITIEYSFADEDLDDDGVINSEDLDSDGDGCFDVIEAGFSEDDEDGILGVGTPTVDADGKVISAPGYGCEEGETDCIELQYNFLNPNFNTCDLYDFGITINTKSIPNTQFDVVYNDLTLNDLLTGNDDSEIRINTDETIINEIYITVQPTETRTELKLKVVQQVDLPIEVLVEHNGIYKPYSTSFYDLVDDVLSFKTNSNIQELVPFNLNLSNGVYYDRTENLSLVVNNEIDLTNASWTINGPNNFAVSLSPNGNAFSWDGTQALSGNYEFTLNIQNKIFTGQFLIANN